MNKIKKLLSASSILALPVLLTPIISMAFTQGPAARAANQPIPALVNTSSDLQSLFCSIIGWFFWFIIVLSVIMVLVAAFDYVTAGDDTEKTTKGRKRLTYAAVGIIIALLAAGFPQIVGSLFPGSTISFNTSTCSVLGG